MRISIYIDTETIKSNEGRNTFNRGLGLGLWGEGQRGSSHHGKMLFEQAAGRILVWYMTHLEEISRELCSVENPLGKSHGVRWHTCKMTVGNTQETFREAHNSVINPGLPSSRELLPSLCSDLVFCPSDTITNLLSGRADSFVEGRNNFELNTYSYLPRLFCCPLLQGILGLWEPKMSNKQTSKSLSIWHF